jgi:hypothetical protein
MNKEEFLFRLREIINEVRRMNQETFEDRFKDGNIRFHQFDWDGNARIRIFISMNEE